MSDVIAAIFLSREVSSDMDKMHPLVSVGSTVGSAYVHCR